MLEISGLILDFLQLILGASSYFASDMTNKRIKFPKAFSQQGFGII